MSSHASAQHLSHHSSRFSGSQSSFSALKVLKQPNHLDLHSAVKAGDLAEVKNLCQEIPVKLEHIHAARDRDVLQFLINSYLMNGMAWQVEELFSMLQTKPGSIISGVDLQVNQPARSLGELFPQVLRSSIHQAVISGNTDLVVQLQERGADINQRDSLGFSLVHLALKANKLETAEYLLSQNVKVRTFAGKKRKETPLLAAIKSGNRDVMFAMVKALSEQDGSITRADYKAAKSGATRRYLSQLEEKFLDRNSMPTGCCGWLCV